MSFYPAVPPAVTPAPGEDAAAELLGRAVMVAVRLADLASPAGPGLGKDGRSALVTAGAGKIRKGDLVVFLKPVAVAAAVVRRDGRVQAAGHPADHVRLGVAEERLDALCGRPGVIDEIARDVTLKGKIKGNKRGAVTPALAIRFVLLITLMPHNQAEGGDPRSGDPVRPAHDPDARTLRGGDGRADRGPGDRAVAPALRAADGGGGFRVAESHRPAAAGAAAGHAAGRDRR